MAIHDGESLKAVVSVNMPDAVEAINVFYFTADFTDDQPEADIVEEIGDWVEALYSELTARVSELVTLGEVQCYTYDGVIEVWDPIGSKGVTAAFAAVDDMLPHGVALMIRAYTSNPRVIGRKYFAGLTEAQQEDGGWVAAALTMGANIGNRWDTTIVIDANNELHPAVFSTKYLTTMALSGVEVVLADPTYQRRRRPGVGS